MTLPSAAEAGELIMPARGMGVRRGASVAMLVLLLIGGVSAKLGVNGETAIYDHAPPPVAANNDLLQGARPGAMVELGLLSARESIEAIPALNLPADEQTLMAEAVRRGRLRLIRLPLFDADPVSDALGNVPVTPKIRSLELSSAGYTVPLVLTRRPVIVTLPIDRAAAVAFRGVDGIRIGALTLTGPVRLSPLSGGQPLTVRVVAQ